MSESATLKRPKPGDDEDELIRMQEEFFQSKQTPSVKIINANIIEKSSSSRADSSSSGNRSNTAPKIRSKFSERKKLKSQENSIAAQTSGEIIHPSIRDRMQEEERVEKDDPVQNIPSISDTNIILGNIVERKFCNFDFKLREKVPSDSFESGFPKVFPSNDLKTDGTSSLFWQNIAQKKVTETKNQPSLNSESNSLIESSWTSEIHEANLKKLQEMSHEEILQEKKRLEETLSPDLIAFIKSRKNKKQKNTEKNIANLDENLRCSMEIDKSQEKDENVFMECDDNSKCYEKGGSASDVPEPLAKIMEEANNKGWVHMDSVEPEKVKWMEDVSVKKEEDPPPNEPYNARFDFNGLLLPYKDESVTVDKGLHHHGEEPDRPGYSLQELLQLSRSATQQQRCTALKTLANIMEKSRKGWYDKVLQPSPLPALNERNIFLLLRFSLDDTSVAIVTAALQTLRAFLFSESDEFCLDKLFGWFSYSEPTLTPPPTDVKDTSDLKDHELAQIDTVSVALRSDIVLRIRYILNEMHPPPVGVNSAMEILIRLARHSHTAALNIASTPHLLEIIVKHFLPLSTSGLMVEDAINNAYGVPLVTAVRLCRVLVTYGGKAVAERLHNLHIMHSILSYINCEPGISGINLCIESLRLWRLLLNHEIAIESINGAQLTLLSQIQLLLSNHNIGEASELNCEHAAALITVAECHESLRQNISLLLAKWSTQLGSLNSQVVESRLKLLAITLKACDDVNYVKTSNFSNRSIFRNLCSSSNLLSGCEISTERDPSSLPSLGVLTQGGQLQPIISQHSSIPFLATILQFFYKHKRLQEIQEILRVPEFIKYISKIEESDWSLETSWYTRVELFLLSSTVRAGSLLGNSLDTRTRHVIWKIAIKLVSTLPADLPKDVKEMLDLALSNEKLKFEQILNDLSKLQINLDDEKIEIELPNNVAAVYKRYVELNGTWDQRAMPKDWVYLPIVNIYTKSRAKEECNEQDEKMLTIILTLELVLPELVRNLSATLRFSRLVLVYLCGTVYLKSNVSLLIRKTMRNLLEKNYKNMDFAMDIPGLGSFTDLYTALCEHFCSTSYGDRTFGIILSIPISQKHDVHYRKMLWSEHAAVLRYLRFDSEALLIPFEEYLYPLEKDASLIESYLTALIRGTVKKEWSPFVYKVALHHSAMYLKEKTKLAERMRKGIEKISNKDLSVELLNYEPSKLCSKGLE